MEAQPLKVVLENVLKRLEINIPDISDASELPCWSCGRMVEATKTPAGFYNIPECIECRRRHFREILDSESGLERRHKTFTLKAFEKFSTKTESQIKTLKVFKNYNFKQPRSVYLYGPNGSGKTHLTCILCHRLLDNFQRVLFRTGVQILYRIRETFSGGNQISTRGMVEWFSEAPFLIIDDLGVEKMTEWVRETFYVIIEARNTKMLPTIVTTNNTPAELAVKLDGEGQPDRIVSRLLHDAIVLQIDDAPDFRVKGYLKKNDG